MAESRNSGGTVCQGHGFFQFTLEFPNPNEGGIGPQPHPSFVGFFSAAAIDDGDREVEGAGEDTVEGNA